jgi:hypothetical protein
MKNINKLFKIFQKNKLSIGINGVAGGCGKGGECCILWVWEMYK